MTNLPLLREVLAVPTKSRLEAKMIAWLVRYFDARHIRCEVDAIGNVYVTKGVSKSYPCVCAHTDSVHDPRQVRIVQKDDRLVAVDGDMRQCGLGGDDKSGIFICLELIERFSVLKAAFFVSEEIGCVGSRSCDEDFFADVGYVMEFDSPCDTIMTYCCDGTQLFPDEGTFADIMTPIVIARGVNHWQNHPFTDVSVLKRKFDFPCLNLPAGYFRMHSSDEYVSIKAVENAIELGSELREALGTQSYTFKTKHPHRDNGKPRLPVTGLITHG